MASSKDSPPKVSKAKASSRRDKKPAEPKKKKGKRQRKPKATDAVLVAPVAEVSKKASNVNKGKPRVRKAKKKKNEKESRAGLAAAKAAAIELQVEIGDAQVSESGNGNEFADMVASSQLPQSVREDQSKKRKREYESSANHNLQVTTKIRGNEFKQLKSTAVTPVDETSTTNPLYSWLLSQRLLESFPPRKKFDPATLILDCEIPLTLEELAYIQAPRYVSKAGGNTWEVLQVQPWTKKVPVPLGVEEDLEPVYACLWSKSDETSLWNKWTSEDEACLRKISREEIVLWHMTERLYGIVPPDIMTGSLFVTRAEEGGVEFTWFTLSAQHQTVYLEPHGWSRRFCELLSRVICCPAFSSNLNFLRYILEYTVYLRVADENQVQEPSLPRRDFAAIIDTQRSMNRRKSLSTLGVDVEEVNDLFRHHGNQYPYLDFISDLRRVVPIIKGNEDPKLCSEDLKDIIFAWDNFYIERKEKLCISKSIQEAKNGYDKCYPVVDILRPWEFKQPIWGKKRDWIMSCRRKSVIQLRTAEGLREQSPAQVRKHSVEGTTDHTSSAPAKGVHSDVDGETQPSVETTSSLTAEKEHESSWCRNEPLQYDDVQEKQLEPRDEEPGSEDLMASLLSSLDADINRRRSS